MMSGSYIYNKQLSFTTLAPSLDYLDQQSFPDCLRERIRNGTRNGCMSSAVWHVAAWDIPRRRSSAPLQLRSTNAS
jgi:hypothetical protein